MTENDSDRSLEQIENDYWGEPEETATYLISTVHRLRRIPVRALEAEDLRILLGQHVGLETLIPVALKRLQVEPLLEGDYFPGDVLYSVLKAPDSYWVKRDDELELLKTIVNSLGTVDGLLSERIEHFKQRHS